jgi:hypothetical protein
MISLPDREAMTAALAKSLPTDLHTLLNNIIEHAARTELLDLTYIVVVEPGDTAQAITEELAASPLINPIQGIRYDEAGFHPYWAHLTQRGRYFELIHPIGNDGFAFVLLIDAAGESELVSMCERYLGEPV